MTKFSVSNYQCPFCNADEVIYSTMMIIAQMPEQNSAKFYYDGTDSFLCPCWSSYKTLTIRSTTPPLVFFSPTAEGMHGIVFTKKCRSAQL